MKDKELRDSVGELAKELGYLISAGQAPVSKALQGWSPPDPMPRTAMERIARLERALECLTEYLDVDLVHLSAAHVPARCMVKPQANKRRRKAK